MSTSPSARPRSPFRGDIQGLRAVAVLIVIIGHAGFGLFPGGFVGVDVFFVISGFLITQLLVAEVARTGSLSLIDFYGRRARRILPAASLVLMATIAMSSLWLGFLRAPDAIRDSIWSAFFAANIRFATVGTDYFAQDLPPSPVQHYWSLAVEEQFYLVWPLVIIGCLLLHRRLRGGQPQTAATDRVPVALLVAAILAISLPSLIWSVLRTHADPAAAYFSTFTRGWELGVGALTALLVYRAPRLLQRLGRVQLVQEVLALAGLGAIVLACVRLDEATPFPGLIAALPVLGSAAVLLSGAITARPTLTGRLLSIRPARTLGDWSYSLYLWHWPLLVVAAVHLQRPLELDEKFAILALTLVLSALTYRFVETPLRRPELWRRTGRALVLYPVTVLMVIAVAAAGSAYTSSLVNRGGFHPPISLGREVQAGGAVEATALVHASVRAARHGQAIPSDLSPPLVDLNGSVADLGDCDYEKNVRRLCPHGDPDGTKTLVVVGNSHGRHWIPAVDVLAKHAGYRAYYLVKPQCVGSLVTPDLGSSDAPFTDCADFHTWMLEQVQDLKPDLVIASTSPTGRGVYDADGDYHTGRADVNGLLKSGYVALFQTLAEDAGRVVVIRDIPYLDGDPGTCLSTGDPDLGSCLLKPTQAGRQASADQIDAAKEAGVEGIDPTRWFCWHGVCPSVVGATIVHRDQGHMTNEYSHQLAEPLGHALGLWD